jgi:hypothetical protein
VSGWICSSAHPRQVSRCDRQGLKGNVSAPQGTQVPCPAGCATVRTRAVKSSSVDQQLCRWLLLSLDRLLSNQLTMTQELIANMLGVRREGVTEAAGK